MIVPTIGNLQYVFAKVVSAAISLSGIVLFVLLLVGGFKYITSGGDPKATEAAQKTITYAVIGLILILASYLILLLISKITGVDVTKINLTV